MVFPPLRLQQPSILRGKTSERYGFALNSHWLTGLPVCVRSTFSLITAIITIACFVTTLSYNNFDYLGYFLPWSLVLSLHLLIPQDYHYPKKDKRQLISVLLSQPDKFLNIGHLELVPLVLISLSLKKLDTYQTSHQRRILSAVIHVVCLHSMTEPCGIVEFSMSAE